MKRLTIAVMGLLCANMAWAVCNPHMKPTTPSVDFEVHNNGTVTHKTTGLMWKVCAEGTEYQDGTCAKISGSTQEFTWAAALNHVHNLNNAGGFAGYTDWRLPNIKELSSIVERSCDSPALNVVIFPRLAYRGLGSQYYWYWSSSVHTSEFIQAWVANHYAGELGSHVKHSSYYVRLVRTP